MARALRIVTVMPFFAWRLGGSVEIARLVSRELARRGHDVRVLTTDVGEPSAACGWSLHDGCRVFRARARGWHSVPPYLPPAALMRAVRAALPTADLVTSHVGLTLLGMAVGALCAQRGVPFVYAAHGALDAARLRQKRRRKALFVRLCERPLLRRAAALHALSVEEAADLRRLGTPAQRIFVVPNGIDPGPWHGGDGVRVRQRWGIPRTAMVVLFLGRLAREKGLELGLGAALPWLRANPSSRFVAAGPDGGAGADLLRIAARGGVRDRVLLPGAVAPGQRADVLAAADLFAYPSLGEGLPLAVLEAAAAGLPLWITDRCNLPEVAEFAAGTVAPPRVPALRAALARLTDSDRERRTCAGNARRMVRERFALSTVVDRLEQAYAGLLR